MYEGNSDWIWYIRYCFYGRIWQE